MIYQQRAYFNFDKFIIDGKIYRGQETKEPPFLWKYSVTVKRCHERFDEGQDTRNPRRPRGY